MSASELNAEALCGMVLRAELIERKGDYFGADELPSVIELKLTYADGRVLSLIGGSCECCGADWTHIKEHKA